MRRHRTFAAVGFSAATALAIVPHGTILGWIVNTSIGATAVCAVVAGIRINHPARPGPWVKIGLGVGCLVVGDAIAGVYAYILHRPIPSVSPADAFYLLACIILMAAAFGFVRGAGRDPDAVIDAGIAFSGGAVLLWSLILAPSAASPIPLFERIVVGFYPLIDLAILAVVIRLVLARTPRPPVVWWVLGSFAVLLTADVAYALLQQTSAYEVGLLDAIWLWAYIGLGVAALHPGMRVVASSRSERRVAPLDSMRISLLCISLLVAPVMLLVTEVRERSVGTSVIAALSVIVAMLVVLRVARTTRSRQRGEAILEYQGLHDPVTGLANRRLLIDRLEQAMARIDRSSSGVAVAFLDLDRFKEVNDKFGHATGDQLLESVATRLSAAVRPTDTVARIGGDEFVVLCADLQGRANVAAMGSRILGAFTEGFPLETIEPFVSASVGVAFTDTRMSAEKLLRDADTAMYRAKELGRNRIEFFDVAVWTEGSFRLETADELHSAIQRNEFRLAYQPIVELATGRVVSSEALVRWEHPTKGILGPDRFIPIAESSGLIVPLGWWIIRETLTEAERWDARGGRLADLGVGINVSAIQLRDAGFAEGFGRIAREVGIDPGRIWIELTESTLIDEAQASNAIAELRNLGMHVSLDDFGTGYSSLSYLHRFPLDSVKIDRSFVAGIGIDTSRTVIMEAIVGIAERLGFTTVAEGVETEEQFDRLRELGCTFAQGNLISRPTAPDGLEVAIDTWLETRGMTPVRLSIAVA